MRWPGGPVSAGLLADLTSAVLLIAVSARATGLSFALSLRLLAHRRPERSIAPARYFIRRILLDWRPLSDGAPWNQLPTTGPPCGGGAFRLASSRRRLLGELPYPPSSPFRSAGPRDPHFAMRPPWASLDPRPPDAGSQLTVNGSGLVSDIPGQGSVSRFTRAT